MLTQTAESTIIKMVLLQMHIYMHTVNFTKSVLVTLALYAALSGCATLASRSETRDKPVDSNAESIKASVSPGVDTGDYWFRLANAYAEEERLEEAENAYKEALKHGKGVKALHNLGLVQVWLGVKALREARSQLPPDEPAHLETRRYLNALLQGL